MDVWDGDGIDTAATFEEVEDGDLACRTTVSFSFPDASKIAFLDFDLSGHDIRCLGCQLLRDQLPVFMEIQGRRLTIDPT